MCEKKEIGEQINRYEQSDIKEKMEITMHRLQELKERVSELKRRCEEFRNMEWKVQHERMNSLLEGKYNLVRCDKCRRALDPDQHVVFKGSDGAELSHYHRKCFQTLFK